MKESARRYRLGFDLGGTKMMAAVFDEEYGVVSSLRAKTKGADGAAEVLERIQKLIEDVLGETGIKKEELEGIGVGCPGPLDLDRGIILHAPNLAWHNVPLKQTLEKTFKCRTVIANDVDAGTYGEYRFGAARDARCVLGVFPGTGIGGACVYEGRIIRGRTGSCMEIGHVRVEADGRQCGCGQRGCLESVAGRLAISAEAAAAVYRGEAPALRRLAGTDLSEIKSGTLAKAIQAGDAVVETIVRNAARRIGSAIADAVNLLAPDVVVLGGGLVEALPDLIVGDIRKAVRGQAMRAFTSDLRIVSAKLGDNATVLGAAALAAAGGA
ncbi:MAG: ROK family protein [Candidatus Aminicenantes bacterium]|nr:ROK family protein [Candidatus Aminicenantes bacterium]